MTSYRQSHVGQGIGDNYDAMHARKVDSLIWDYFIKDYVGQALGRCAAAGAQRYLDFACGTGRVLKLGSQFFPEPVGIDISSDMLVVARKRVPGAELYCTDVTTTPSEIAGSFDCVSLFRFLLNAEPSLRKGVLEWLANHMNKGAMLIGNNHMEMWSISGLVTVTANIVARRNRNHLSRRAIETLLVQAGFRLECWAGFRVLPSVMGRPILGRALQLRAERLVQSLGLERFGVEQIFIAHRA